MSVQVAKSSAATTERRTPLQMSGSGKSNKTQQQNVAETEKEKEKDTATKEQNPPSTSINNPKVVAKGQSSESTDLKKGTDKKNTNTDNQTTENSNSAKDTTVDEKKKDDKKKDAKEAVKKDDKKQENGVNEGREGNKANGHKDVEKKIRETPRQKDLREQKEKEEKEQEAKKLKDAADELRKSIAKIEESEMKNQEVNVSRKEEEKEPEVKKKNRKEPETPKKGEKKSRDVDSETLTKETQISPKTPSTNKSPLTPEKDSKEFSTEDEGMEPLLFDTEVEVNVGRPVETSTPGKVLKLKQNPSRSYEHQEIFNRYAQISATERDRTDSLPPEPLERPQFTASYRSISGRRSLRPPREYSFHGSSSGTYRKVNTELDYTTSSMNATIGSDIPNESSFSLFGRNRKRDRTPPVMVTKDADTAAQVNSELSPKRLRLDFSGILGVVATPVTLLRAKLGKAKIQCSTPNGMVTSSTPKDEEDGVENVSMITMDEMATPELSEAVGDVGKNMDVEQVDLDEDELIDDADEELEEPGDMKKPAQTQQQQPVSTTVDIANKRRMCNIM